MTEEQSPTRAEEAWSDLYNWLDSSGGTVSTLRDALRAAEEAGADVRRERKLAVSMGSDLQEAFDRMDGEEMDVDAETVLDHVLSASNTAKEINDEMDTELADFELPDWVKSGVYDTVGGYAEYVYKDSIAVRQRAEQFAEESG